MCVGLGLGFWCFVFCWTLSRCWRQQTGLKVRHGRDSVSRVCLVRRFGALRSCSTGLRKQPSWVLLTLFWCFTLFRVGEAAHPGPTSSTANQWTFGVFNPSGLNAKTDLVANLPGDVWVASETRLTQNGVRKLRVGLRALKSDLGQLVPGYPCRQHADRQRAEAGNNTGVLLLSKYPARALPHSFDADMFAQARCQVAGVLIGNLWVQVGFMYGFPVGLNHKYPALQSDGILEALVDRVALQTVGPRILCGDLNHDVGELPQYERLLQLGWRECQDIRALHQGIQVEGTGRGSRRLDHIWLSPELLPFVAGVEVRRDLWPDHASVAVTFDHPGLTRTISTWYRPLDFPWPDAWQSCVRFDTQTDPSLAYAQLWQQVEWQAASQLLQEGGSCFPKQFGRGVTVHNRSSTLQTAPAKLGRAGKPQPQFYGLSLKHNRWFRQLRRLQHLSQTLAKLEAQPGSAVSLSRTCAVETWQAVRQAPGFGFGFALWWQESQLEPHFVPAVPFDLPSAAQVRQMFLSFQGVVRQFESKLAQSRYKGAKTKHANDVKHIYQDLRADATPQVDTLVLRLEAVVDEVRVDELAVTLDRVVNFDSAKPLVSNGKVLAVINCCQDQVWLEDVENIRPGDVVCQEDVKASEADIAEQFRRVWEPRWNKLSHLQEGQWDQILDFLDRSFTSIPWTFPSWEPVLFDSLLNRKKAKSAVGADGVSKRDLMALPVQAKEELCQLFRSVEDGSAWPVQLSTGIVTSLAKHAMAAEVDSFRPITVYPLLYRMWSSCRARSALQSLVDHLPPGIQGCIPGRQAKVIWFEVAQLLESAHWEHKALSGLLLDIRKAFNALPRAPVWFMLHKLNFPPGVLRAWVAFVSQQTRRFRVRQATSEPIGSCVGFPEGCALSIVAMTLIDWALHSWLQAVSSSYTLLAYVDDWTVTFEGGGDFHEVWTSIKGFAAACDLELDPGKSCAWATTAADRRALHEGPLPVAHNFRLLGAHENFCLRAGNSTLVARLSVMPATWVKLRNSLSPYRFKIVSLLTVAWPRALHGIAVVHLGAQHFATLRAGAMRGLKADRIGANATAHLASFATLADPEAWGILQTIKDARDFGGGDNLQHLLSLLSADGHGLPYNGPSTVLAVRLARLGWTLNAQGLCEDQIGSFSVLHVSFEELWMRFRVAWPGVVWDATKHRATFDGIHRADLARVQTTLRSYGDADQVFLRCHLDGTSYIQNQRAHWQPDVSSQCPFCEQQDGFYHRAWVCPFFADCRVHMSPSDLAVVPGLPRCLSCHGWAVLSPSWILLLRALDKLVDPSTPVAPCGLAATDQVDLFVDGACTAPVEKQLRLAAWAVTAAGPPSQRLEHMVLAGAPLAGIVQTAFRAELRAVLEALRIALGLRCRVRIWSDCLGVVRGVRKRLSGHSGTTANVPHADLWRRIDDILQQLDCSRIQIVKVVSHGDIQKAADAGEDWAFWHNNLVDEAASGFNDRRGAEFWELFQTVEAEVLRDAALHSAIARVHLLTGRKADRQQQPERNTAPPPLEEDDAALPVPPDVWPFPEKLVRRYGRSNVDALHRWWVTVGDPMMRSATAGRWISGLQLLLDFVATTGYAGPVVQDKKWYAKPEDRPRQTEISWPERSRAFLSLLKSYLGFHGVVLASKSATPRSASIVIWSVCFKVRWSQDRLDRVDSIVLGQLGKQAVKPTDLLTLQPFLVSEWHQPADWWTSKPYWLFAAMGRSQKIHKRSNLFEMI